MLTDAAVYRRKMEQVRKAEGRDRCWSDDLPLCFATQPGRLGPPFMCTEPRNHEGDHKADALGRVVVTWPLEADHD